MMKTSFLLVVLAIPALVQGRYAEPYPTLFNSVDISDGHDDPTVSELILIEADMLITN